MHRPADPFPAAGDPCADAPPEGVANFGRYRFRRELASVSAALRAVNGLSNADVARALDVDALDRAKTGHARYLAEKGRHLRLVR